MRCARLEWNPFELAGAMKSYFTHHHFPKGHALLNVLFLQPVCSCEEAENCASKSLYINNNSTESTAPPGHAGNTRPDGLPSAQNQSETWEAPSGGQQREVRHMVCFI